MSEYLPNIFFFFSIHFFRALITPTMSDNSNSSYRALNRIHPHSLYMIHDMDEWKCTKCGSSLCTETDIRYTCGKSQRYYIN